MRFVFRAGVWWLIGVFVVSTAGVLRAQEVLRVTWPTRHAAAPADDTPEAAPYLPLVRASLDRMPESAVVKLALKQASTFGFSSGDADVLGELVNRRYAKIAADPAFKNVESTLPYCLAETRPRQGVALVYRPRGSNAQTPVLLFVHGEGGSFLWYAQQLAEWFPDHIVVCPSYGVWTAEIPAAYLEDSLRAAAGRLNHGMAKPALVGLAAGGFGVARVYAANPAAYRHVVVMAAYAPDDAFRVWPKTARAAFLVGEREDYVRDGGFGKYAKSLAARSAQFQSKVVPGADAMFMLTHAAETRAALRGWMGAAGGK